MRIVFKVIEGAQKGTMFVFKDHDNFVVGRSRKAHCQVSKTDRTLSRFHFMVEVNPPLCRLMDMASFNGTFVNDRKVTQADLKHGDRIRCGALVLEVQIQDAPRTNASEGVAETIDLNVLEGTGYRIDRELGRGGMGVVYRARKAPDAAPVAVKTIAPAVADTEAAVARFLREASILRELNHPRIVGFREIGYAAGRLYFVMDYVEGSDARSLLKARNRSPAIGDAVNLTCQALEGLAYAHEKGFVHRDIKPANLLVTRAPTGLDVRLADFGLARLYQSSSLSGLTLAGQAGGTVGFLPPEQITNFRQAKPSADLYSIGATLYYLLSGKRIYDFPSDPVRRLSTILQEEPVPIRSRRTAIPEPLAEVIHRALAREPLDRWPSAEEMRQHLLPFCDTTR